MLDLRACWTPELWYHRTMRYAVTFLVGWAYLAGCADDEADDEGKQSSTSGTAGTGGGISAGSANGGSGGKDSGETGGAQTSAGESGTSGGAAGRGSNAGKANGGSDVGAAGSGARAGRGGSGNAGTAQGGTGNSVVDPGVAGEAPYDWVGVIGTGQSLSVGWEAPAISTMPSAYGNIVLHDDGPDPRYPIDDSGSPVWSYVPLSEPVRMPVDGYGDSPEYPNNIWHAGDLVGESPHSAMADTVSEFCLAREHTCVTAHTVVGVGGMGLTGIDKQSRGFAAAMHEVSLFKAFADDAGKSYGVGSIIFTHGETDASNSDYAPGVYQLWSDYNDGVKAITGQEEDVVMLASQQSSFPSNYGASYGSAVQLWQASVDHPRQIIVTGPKYQYGPYGLHMSAVGYGRVGEKYGEIHDLVVNRKVAWRPLEPKAVSRDGAVLTVEFNVPNPPLVWDEQLSMPHQAAHTAWSQGRGFEVVRDGATELEIASVEIDRDNVRVTLAEDPGDASLVVGYAVTQDTGDNFQGGTDLGPHGQLRDSDPFTGPTTDTVEYNYCVHFAMPVP